jgi:pyridoxine 5-phosphate synthase
MTELGVNIDHVATIRQARGTSYPDLVTAASLAEEAGAVGITIHLREDRRHIQDADVRQLRHTLRTRMNLEMAVVPEIIAIACEEKPEEVCLVPEKRQELTTEGGLDVLSHQGDLARAIQTLHKEGILVSLFIDPHPDHIKAAKDLGAEIIEIHTGTYANLCDSSSLAPPEEWLPSLRQIANATELGLSLGLQVNAGHGLHYDNVQPIASLPGMGVLNIGHSIVARAIFVGMIQAVCEMIEKIQSPGPPVAFVRK